jgi:flagellar assembly factor FliW
MTVATLPEKLPTSHPTADGLIEFPDGLLGFPSTKRYQLAVGPGEGLFWLLGLGAGDPSFLVSDPFTYFDGYSVDLTTDQTSRIAADHQSQVAVLAIAVPGPAGSAWTANTQGPIVINVEKGIGAQLVLTDQTDALRRPFRPRGHRAAD